MMRRGELSPPFRRMALSVVCMLALLLASCGFDDDADNGDDIAELDDSLTVVPDDEEGTPEPPELSTDQVSPETDPVESLPPGVSEVATPDGTPAGPTPEMDVDATPEGIDDIDPAEGATPAPGEEPADGLVATPEEPDAAAPVIGDGTGGAQAEDLPVDATDANGELAEATPDPGVAGTEAVVVESCEPAEIPPFTGDESLASLAEEVNFRAGPGEDCDVLPTSPLLADAEVAITSDPVLRDDQGDQGWVQIDVDGDVGWIAVDFVELDATQ